MPIQRRSAMLRCVLPMIGLCFVAGGAEAACLRYDGAVTVSGIIRMETFPGPPNYESIAAGDAAERGPFLRLDQPACVSAGQVAAGEVPQIELYEIQLDLPDAGRNLDGRRVEAIGPIFPGMTAHHHTVVLLDVKTLSTP